MSLILGVDLTELEGLDELNALTWISELGTDFTKWPMVKHFTSWLGLCPNFKKMGGRCGRATRGVAKAERPKRSGWQELPRGASGSSAFASGCAEGDHGDGAQAGADLEPVIDFFS